MLKAPAAIAFLPITTLVSEELVAPSPNVNEPVSAILKTVPPDALNSTLEPETNNDPVI